MGPSKVGKIYLGSDHAGIRVKNMIIGYLGNSGFELEDMGCYWDDIKAYEEGCRIIDYPYYAHLVARKVTEEKDGRMGILVCGTGIGMSIAANKVRGARAAVCTTPRMAEMARKHNDANILCLGERLIGDDEMRVIMTVNDFLSTDFTYEERHSRRVLMIEPDYPRRG